ncbi:MAG: hypothetical protein Q4D51_07175 [Eubacteriales bacterium]|nr:hypothetical protein [Eubacteriales bacterium]
MRRKNTWESPYIDKKSRKNRRKNQKDQFGIYDLPGYRTQKKTKKSKPFTWKNVFKGVIASILLVVIFYGVCLGVKFSMFDKGRSQYVKEDFESAIQLFEEALKPRLPLFEGFDNNVRLYLADSYVNIGKYDEACYQYNQIKLWKKKDMKGLDYLSQVAYGLQLYTWGEYREALPILSAAYEDGYRDLVLYVGNCYGQIGDMENMQLYYDVFLNNNDMNSFMYAQYAAISLDEGKYDEAFNYINRGKELEDQSNIKEILFDEIVYYEKMKEFDTAYEKAKAFVEAYPNDTDGKNEYDLLFTRQKIE